MSDEDRLDPERYEDDEDGLPREIVGPWVREKHARLEHYANISRAVRRMFIGTGKAGANFIELFSGPGRARIRGTREVIDGSAIAALREAVRSGAPFSQVFIGDATPRLARACEHRLKIAGANVHCEIGPATETIDRIVARLDPRGLHFAFLDPYNLDSLPFEIIRKLARFERMDILMHVSAMDLQMNLRTYIERKGSQIDAFAPGWRSTTDLQSSDDLKIRGQILAHWRALLKQCGMETTESHELIQASTGQRLYWLAFAARHERALEFWQKIRDVNVNKQWRLFD